MTLAAGTRLGPYEILALIGAGGMGEVYRARDTRLDRIVAIKVSSAGFSERFEREASAVAKGPLPLGQALRYAAQICDALDAAHRKSIVHRDLKPANILVTKTGVKLLDFGLAKRNRAREAAADATETIALTKANTILGTLQYMSPEQLQGAEADARSDIFSFGAVLYEMVTGKRAFEGASQASVIASILDRHPPPLSSLDPAAPRPLERVVSKGLAKGSRKNNFTWARGAAFQAAMTAFEPAFQQTPAESRRGRPEARSTCPPKV